MQEELAYCAGDHALNRLPREAVKSLTGNIQEPSGHNPVQCVLRKCAEQKGWAR